MEIEPVEFDDMASRATAESSFILAPTTSPSVPPGACPLFRSVYRAKTELTRDICRRMNVLADETAKL